VWQEVDISYEYLQQSEAVDSRDWLHARPNNNSGGRCLDDEVFQIAIYVSQFQSQIYLRSVDAVMP
jgi:hypothetical protein